MFTKTELEFLSQMLGHANRTAPREEDAHICSKLKRKVDDAIKDMRGGAYRGTLAKVTDEDLDWLEDGDDDIRDLVDRSIITKSSKLAAQHKLGKSLTAHYDRLREQLRRLKPQVELQAENERLKLELAAVGPPEAQEEIDILRQKLAAMHGERDVLSSQVVALKAGLRAERIQHMVDEDQKVAAHVDPCLPPATRPCPHQFNYEDCDICKPLLPPATGQ